MRRVKSLEVHIWEVEDDHAERRLECKRKPKEKRPFQPRPRPKTALIAYAVQRKMAQRLQREPELTNVPKKMRSPKRA